MCNKKIEIEELTFLLNNRTKTIDITNNSKKKNISNFIKTVYVRTLIFLIIMIYFY